MRQNISYIFTALLLLALASCQQRAQMPEPDNTDATGGYTMSLTVVAPDADPSLRAHLSGEAGDPVLKATFKEDDDIALFVWQDGKLYDLANVGFASVEEGGKRATLTFELPAGVDETKPIDLIAYDGPADFGYKSGTEVRRSYMLIEGDKILINGMPYGPIEIDKFSAPVMFHEKGIIPSETERTERFVKFKHFGCYEVIFFTNNSDTAIEPRVGLSQKGRSKYGMTRKWAYESQLDMTDFGMKYPYINLTTGELFYSKDTKPSMRFASTGKLEPGASVTLVSWYVPNAKVTLPEMELAYKNGYDWVVSDQKIAAKDFPMEIGKAYAVSGSWDGTKVTIGEVTTIEPSSITLDQTELTIKVGKKATLTPTIEPADASNKNVTWSSSDETVATVSDGVVTGVKVGTAEITAKTANGLTTKATVTVEEIPVTKINLPATEASMTIGGTMDLKPVIEPADATNTHISWRSSDPDVATVDANGRVTAKGAGTATITGTAASGVKVTLVVTVSDEVIEVTAVTLDKNEATVKVGKSLQLTATIEPSGATDQKLEWTSSDSDIAIVTDGRVTGVAPGEVTITVKTTNGKTAICTITVEKTKGVPDVPGVEL
ncbi:MAG: Ig-like domain-containing protein [Porphyromonas sp.]|uniref:Ig-like domain-containing protein n=1 Tax=Porphyromonas sp. TaxID=1924944 RepID=UPI002A918EED|nr:Ig-like domain-containing protein [Porphyromonas sp.]MDD7469472.1 Ig-like domain-containing protein [Bacteroidales bacterium]MDY6102348.1 Ig-like domain-containing protein [Porphyromonas sp.]